VGVDGSFNDREGHVSAGVEGSRTVLPEGGKHPVAEGGADKDGSTTTGSADEPSTFWGKPRRLRARTALTAAHAAQQLKTKAEAIEDSKPELEEVSFAPNLVERALVIEAIQELLKCLKHPGFRRSSR
jgi:hypothetical protein